MCLANMSTASYLNVSGQHEHSKLLECVWPTRAQQAIGMCLANMSTASYLNVSGQHEHSKLSECVWPT
ncbi:hypothetical protein BgiBS90_010335 [Biomphalaria glabrata]|nr:hypothetical protein BgiBS90_010335 [Biomphalaria glabrata]